MFLRKTALSSTVCALLLLAAYAPAYGAPQTDSLQEPISIEEQAAPRSKAVEGAAVVNIVDVTNLRSGPGLEYEIVAKAMPGESYPVVGLEGEWHQVALPSGDTAYVAGWVVEYDVLVYYAHIVEVTNLRSGPGLDYKIVGKGKAGDSFQILGSEGEWYQVALSNGAIAYVAAWVVQTDTDPQQSPQKVYIYHTHNRESWKNVARNTNGTSFDDPVTNITKVGEHLGAMLQKKGIPSLVSKDDITEKLKAQKLSFSYSYSESRKSVKKAMEAHPSLSYFFDIHRDSDVPRKNTTVTIKDKSYARILFVIGTAHPNYAANKKLAEELNKRLNKIYPGLSRGVIAKSAHQGNGEYNQSVSPGSLLMEIGGVNNTLEESLLTAEAFADVFADYYKSVK